MFKLSLDLSRTSTSRHLSWMTSLSLPAAEELLARFPALKRPPVPAQQATPPAREQAEHLRQKQLDQEVQRYDEDNETLRQQMKMVSLIERARELGRVG